MNLLLLVSLVQAAVPAGLTGWEVLRDDQIWVGCIEQGGSPWCRSRTSIQAELASIERILLDVDNYPKVFLRVTRVDTLGPFLLHVVLDMPFPLADRDYVAQYVRREEGNEVVFSWESVKHPAAPPGEAVRLAHSTGEWRLVPDGAATVVTYTWNAELGGDLPEFALPRARLTWGEEVLQWLAKAVARR